MWVWLTSVPYYLRALFSNKLLISCSSRECTCEIGCQFFHPIELVKIGWGKEVRFRLPSNRFISKAYDYFYIFLSVTQRLEKPFLNRKTIPFETGKEGSLSQYAAPNDWWIINHTDHMSMSPDGEFLFLQNYRFEGLAVFAICEFFWKVTE